MNLFTHRQLIAASESRDDITRCPLMQLHVVFGECSVNALIRKNCESVSGFSCLWLASISVEKGLHSATGRVNFYHTLHTPYALQSCRLTGHTLKTKLLSTGKS